MKWTGNDALRSKDAPFVGGPNAGLTIPVAPRAGRLLYPDVVENMDGYEFDFGEWAFKWRPSSDDTVPVVVAAIIEEAT